MEFTLENKAKFFAQYWGQNVYKLSGLSNLKNRPDETFMDDDHLQLKPLYSISQEDSIWICKLKGIDIIGLLPEHIKQCAIVRFPFHSEIYIPLIDYLRSQGYALSWRGLSVEQMVEAGWIKLTSPTA